MISISINRLVCRCPNNTYKLVTRTIQELWKDRQKQEEKEQQTMENQKRAREAKLPEKGTIPEEEMAQR